MSAKRQRKCHPLSGSRSPIEPRGTPDRFVRARCLTNSVSLPSNFQQYLHGYLKVRVIELTAVLASVLVVGLLANASLAAAKTSDLSDVLKAQRPQGGEYFGLYLLNKKVGYLFTDITLAPGSKDRAQAVSELVFRATVGSKPSERIHKEVRVYEAKPKGRLLSFSVEDRGDGGDQTLQGTANASGFRVLRKRPGQPEQVLNLPPTSESVEDADQQRVAILRNSTVEGFILDGQELQSYRSKTTVGPVERRFVRGVKVKLHQVVTLSDKEKVPVEAYLTEGGEMVELTLGPTMKAVSEPESIAKRLDQVEVFALTRVALPRPLPQKVRNVPGSLSLVMSGLPSKFQRHTFRQEFLRLTDDKVEVMITATPPKLAKPAWRPVADPNGGEYLKSSLLVESDNPEIQAQAKKIIGDERDAYLATQKIVSWVSKNMKKAYGASADRATDVLHQMKGDCTEHSLLSVALLRAAGIPAKRVDGLVYMVNDDGVAALYWHEWVEAYVGEWTQLDPTFNQVVADATHFAVGEEASAEITPLIGQLKVLEVK